MQLLMQDWLKLMLDWNPGLRGRRQCDTNNPGPIVAFQTLEKILKAEIVSIFWIEGVSFLSYTVSDDISMEMIQEWIERDTGICPRYQLLLLPRGHAPDLGKSARQLLGCEELGIPCLFSKFNDGSECKLTQVYPEFLHCMLASPREETEYRIQKRMWAQSVYFINHQATLYRKLMHALKIHSYDILYLMMENSIFIHHFLFKKTGPTWPLERLCWNSIRILLMAPFVTWSLVTISFPTAWNKTRTITSSSHKEEDSVIILADSLQLNHSQLSVDCSVLYFAGKVGQRRSHFAQQVVRFTIEMCHASTTRSAHSNLCQRNGQISRSFLG